MGVGTWRAAFAMTWKAMMSLAYGEIGGGLKLFSLFEIFTLLSSITSLDADQRSF